MPFNSVHRNLLILAVLFVAFFQNCGQPGDLALKSAGQIADTSLIPAGTPAGDFTCQTVVLLQSSPNLVIPARSGNGTCYAVKLFDAIAHSKSNLTSQLEYDVVSRNHDTGGLPTRNPYSLGSSLFNLRLEGPRKVKLSGGLSASARILVDNFILVGIYPLGSQPLKYSYKSYGTKDATIDSGETYIEFKNDQIPLQPFASGGTATVEPLELVNDLQAMADYTIDLRALDCGGSRELSDVYALFQ